jgi:homoserine dehydrogenase
MKLILIGYGTVGQSFTRIVLTKQKELVEKYGFSPKIVAIVDSKGAIINPEGLNLKKALKIKEEGKSVAVDRAYGHLNMSGLEAIENVEADIMIEVTPTNVKTGEPGLSHITAALKKKMHVITTNKGPLALALPTLLELATQNNVYLKFSGAVGAGLPVLDFAKKISLGDRIVAIRGILNGTTNFILTRMEEGIPFKNALEEAQKRGYAEADPSLDIDGIDTACKLVIMANWIMDKETTLRDVRVEGIRNIALEDVRDAMKRGFSVKLLGFINEDLVVKPTEIPKQDPLCVKGILNAITFKLELAGEETIIGRGAGGKETATAILRDLLEIAQTSVIM